MLSSALQSACRDQTALRMRGMGYRTVRHLSSRWKRQRDKDIYADRAIREGMRSRAAYKLEEINKRFDSFLRRGANVIDLGAAPGGFSVFAAKKIQVDDVISRWDMGSLAMDDDRPIANIKRTLGGTQVPRQYGRLVCVDRDVMEAIGGAVFVRGDMREEKTQRAVDRALQGQEADVVLSDMAPDTTGEGETNHVRSIALAELAAGTAERLLRNGGVLVVKVFSGSEEMEFRERLCESYTKVRAFRPAATRSASREVYYVAQGFVPEHLRV